MVGEEVVKHSNDIKELQEGAGENASLDLKEIFEAPPHPQECFTLVFKGSLRNFQGNPLRTETPFGVPWACGIGDAFEKIDELEAEIERLV